MCFITVSLITRKKFLVMEVSLLQIIKTKMHTKTDCSSRVVHYFNRKILQFYEGYSIKFTILKALKTK